MLTPGEPVAGFEIDRRREQNRTELQKFQQGGRVRLAEITKETAKRYARICTHLRGIERPIPTNDLWIAASTMEHSAELLTADSYVFHVPQITFVRIPSSE